MLFGARRHLRSMQKEYLSARNVCAHKRGHALQCLGRRGEMQQLQGSGWTPCHLREDDCHLTKNISYRRELAPGLRFGTPDDPKVLFQRHNITRGCIQKALGNGERQGGTVFRERRGTSQMTRSPAVSPKRGKKGSPRRRHEGGRGANRGNDTVTRARSQPERRAVRLISVLGRMRAISERLLLHIMDSRVHRRFQECTKTPCVLFKGIRALRNGGVRLRTKLTREVRDTMEDGKSGPLGMTRGVTGRTGSAVHL